MIIVTGGAGFIGSNIVQGLNNRGREDIIVVDDLTDGKKIRNLSGANILDYLDMDNFASLMSNGTALQKKIDVIFHQGACSTTTEWNGKFMMQNNYEYSKVLLHYCIENKIPFIYASSASVYGINKNFTELRQNENPVNVYGYSKMLFDNYARNFIKKNDCQITGLRYFNVYGPGEQHKNDMASVVWHFFRQLKKAGTVSLFKGSDIYGDGEQRRDFIYIEDIVHANLWFLDSFNSGIFNLGTGISRSFNDVANAVIEWYGKGKIDYISFPAHLKGSYQSFTEADINMLKSAGYPCEFTSLESGVDKYLGWLDNNS